jgi:K+-transporting ATPase ATPase C chain
MNDSKVNYPSSHRKATLTAEPAGSMLEHLRAAVAVTIVLGVICCGVYPLIVWGIGQTLFRNQANGSLVDKNGNPTSDPNAAVGSALLGQSFTQPIYFHPRPSAANNSAGSSFSSTGGYDPTASGGTNFGPLSDELINGLPPAPSTQPAATQASATQPSSTQASAASQPAPAIQFDGIRLRTIHYAVDNGITFHLYHATYHLTKNEDGSTTVTGLDRKEEVPLKDFQDSQGNLNDVALVNAFPHPVAPNGGTAVITDGDNSSNVAYTRVVLIADDFATPIPGDAVTASGSGLDPHISPANAKLQVARVASNRTIPGRKVSPADVQALVDKYTQGPNFGILGDPGVNVLLLNIALDAAFPMPAPTTAPAPATQAAGH